MEKISDRLKYIRKKLNLTQEVLAKEMKVSKQTYSTIEQNNRKLHIEEVIILKNTFNINPNWLLLGLGDEEYITNIKESELVNLILDFRRSYDGEVDIVKIEIIKKILLKFYQQEYSILGIPKQFHSVGNRLHAYFIRILESTNFSGLEEESKNYLRKQIEEYADKPRLQLEIKKELYSLLANINNKDCSYILKNKDITIRLIDQKIPAIDKKINNFLPKFISF